MRSLQRSQLQTLAPIQPPKGVGRDSWEDWAGGGGGGLLPSLIEVDLQQKVIADLKYISCTSLRFYPVSGVCLSVFSKMMDCLGY